MRLFTFIINKNMGNICGKKLEKSTSNHRNSNPVTFRVPAS